MDKTPENKKDERRPSGPGMAGRNNPLGQRDPAGQIGPAESVGEHGQSAELVEKVKKRAAESQREGEALRKQETEYDAKGPERQPGKIVRQKELGGRPRQKQQGQYTQDNEEEGAKV